MNGKFMTIEETTKYLWENSVEFTFKQNKQADESFAWDDDIFTSTWFKKNNFKRLEKAKGLYWFSVKGLDIKDFFKLTPPEKFPTKGINFAETSYKIYTLFSSNVYKKANDELVFYNGQSELIFNRIQTHFALNNNKTGALAIGKYHIPNKEFKVRIFHDQMNFDGLNEENKEYIKRLLNNKTGRESIESCWRIKYGWPILCEK